MLPCPAPSLKEGGVAELHVKAWGSLPQPWAFKPWRSWRKTSEDSIQQSQTTSHLPVLASSFQLLLLKLVAGSKGLTAVVERTTEIPSLRLSYSSVVKHTPCSCRRPEWRTATHMATCKPLWLQFQGIKHPLFSSVVSHMHGMQINSHKHIQIINKSLKLGLWECIIL